MTDEDKQADGREDIYDYIDQRIRDLRKELRYSATRDDRPSMSRSGRHQRRPTPNQGGTASRPTHKGGVAPQTHGGTPVDIIERDDEFILEATVAGFEREEIDARVEAGAVRIEAHRDESDHQADDERRLRQERPRSLMRTVPIPGRIATADVSSYLENGVLTIRLPKTAPTETAGSIDIEEGSDDA